MLTHFSVWVVILVPHQDPVHHVTVLVFTAAQRRIEQQKNMGEKAKNVDWKKGGVRLTAKRKKSSSNVEAMFHTKIYNQIAQL
jgi:hypothetical protein